MRAIAGVTPDWQRLRVFVDGVEVHHCFEADDVEGWATLALSDDGGRAHLTLDGSDIASYRLTGTVRIVQR